MKSILKLSATLVALVTAASTIAWSGPGKGADTQWEHDSFYFDFGGVVIPCLDETMRFYGEVPYKRHTVTTPSGNTSYKFQLVPVTPNTPPYTGVGEVSGKVYHFKNGLPINESFHLGPGEVFSARVREEYRTDDGERLIAEGVIHFTTNANGELTAEKDGVEWTCE